MNTSVSRRLFWLIAGMTVVRAAIAAAAPLLHDEAYYWLWSRRLDWSYLDHPPMIAYLIRLSALGGNGELWVRLPALLLGPVISYSIFLLGRDLFDERAGFLAAVLYQITPVLAGSGLFAVPDAPMFLAWTLTLRFVWQALHGQPQRWTAAGLMLGLGLVSKLFMAFLAIGIAVFIGLHARSWARRREPYLAAVIAAVMLLPVVYWNAVHHWATIEFILHERAEPGAPSGVGWLVRLFTQHLSLVLLLFPAFIWGFWSAWRRRGDERYAYVFWTSVPVVIVTLAAGPFGAARGNWLGPVYIGLAAVLGALWNRFVAGLAVANAALAAIFVALVLLPALPPIPGAREYYGWREAGARVHDEVAALGAGTVIVAHRYHVASQLGYHTRDTIPVLLLPHSNPASIWSPVGRFAGAAAVAVTYAPERFEWERCFNRVEERPPVTVVFRGRTIQEFRVFRLYGLSPSCGTP